MRDVTAYPITGPEVLAALASARDQLLQRGFFGDMRPAALSRAEELLQPLSEEGLEAMTDYVGRALYAASCSLDPVEATEPDWGRGGYKTQVAYWHGLARAAMRAVFQRPVGEVASA